MTNHTQRVTEHKVKALKSFGTPPAKAAKHASNMVARQSTGNPNGTPCEPGQ